MDGRSRDLWAARLATALAGLGMLLALFTNVEAQGKACSLATPEELQAALGAAVSGLKPQPAPGGTADICAGRTPTASVMLRLAKRSGQGGAEAAGIEAAKKMGAQVQVKAEGAITCSTMIPPKTLEQYGFNTTCSVLKDGQVAAIEVTAKSQKDMVTMDSLRKVVEKMAGRF
jgi:hypothetical protein